MARLSNSADGAVGTVGGGAHGEGHEQPHEARRRHNIVMFMPDQLRFDSLGCTGNPVIKTPRFDALAAEGTLFTNCFTQASVCTQSRCSMFTGQYVHTSAHRSLSNLLKPWEGNVFKSLKQNGYHVCSIAPRGDLFGPGVTELCMDEYGFVEEPPNWPPGSSKGPPPPTVPTVNQRLFYRGLVSEAENFDYDQASIDSALEWLQSSPPEPFCLFIPLIYPHPPFKVTDPYYSMYRELELPPRVKQEEKTGHEPLYMEAVRRAHRLERATEEHWRDVKAVYYGMISRLDDQLGLLVDTLKDSAHGALWDRTYTLMFTDHGEYLGDSSMVEKWPSGLHEVLTRDPLIIVGPDLPRGQVNDAMCEMVDLTPTLLELVGIKNETYPHSGKSLVSTIMTNATEHKPYAFSEGGFLKREEPLLEVSGFPYDQKSAVQHEQVETVGRAVSVRDKQWAYTYRLYEPAELFDRLHDPGERHNVAEDPAYAAIVLKLEKVIMRWMVETSDYVPYDSDPRFPDVALESTAAQIKARRGVSSKFNH